MLETTSFTNYSHHNFTAGKTESQKREWFAVGGQHSPSGKRRRKDRAGDRGAGVVVFLSPGLHSLLSSSGWGPICISASLCIQPVNGLSGGSIKGLVEESQLEHLELKIPSHFFQLEGPMRASGGSDISTWVWHSEYRQQKEQQLGDEKDRNTDGS